MIIRKIKIENFGVLRGPLSVDLGSGVNVISGPNRIGKSTLMRAVHAVMTLRSKITGGTRERFVPYGGGTPEVTLVLEDATRSLTITKRFGGQAGSTTLALREVSGGFRQLQGTEADDAFYEIMGVRPAGRGAPGDELCGVLPLIWVEQGTSATDPSHKINTDTRETLRDLLEAETGVALGGPDAARVYERVQGQYNRYYTGGGRLTLAAGYPYADAKRDLDKADETLSALRVREEAHIAALTSYACVSGDLERLDAEIPNLQGVLTSAEERVRRVADLSSAMGRTESALRLAKAESNAANIRSADRRQLREDVRQAIIAVSNHQTLAERGQISLDSHRFTRAQFDNSLVVARAADDQGRAELRRLELERDVTAARDQLHEVTTQLETATAQQLAITSANEELERLGVNHSDVVELRRLHSEAEVQRAALEAAAARVRVKALGDVAVRVGDEISVSMRAGETTERAVARATPFVIGELAEIEVVPGGADLGAMDNRVRIANASLSAKLRKAGAKSLADAEARENTRGKLKADADTAQAVLSQVAGGGVQALEHRAAVARGTVQRLEAEIQDVGGTRSHAISQVGASFETRLAQARQGVATAATRVQDAERSSQAHDRAERGLDSAVVASRSAASQANIQLQAMTSRLASSVTNVGNDERLEEVRVLHAETSIMRQGALDAATSALAAENPENSQRSHARCVAGLAEAQRQRAAKLSERDRLEGQLTSGDLAGMHERLGDAEAASAVARRVLDQQERYARALALLNKTLVDSRSQTQQAFREPLMRRLLPLLQSLHPGTSVELDDDFNIVRFARPGVGEDSFGTLSGGESEQFGLVVRLALAQVLSERQSLPVMIDDGLVHTDDQRMQRLLDILASAGRSLQLIICTCHPERYRGLARTEQCIDLESSLRS